MHPELKKKSIMIWFKKYKDYVSVPLEFMKISEHQHVYLFLKYASRIEKNIIRFKKIYKVVSVRRIYKNLKTHWIYENLEKNSKGMQSTKGIKIPSQFLSALEVIINPQPLRVGVFKWRVVQGRGRAEYFCVIF